MYHSTCVLQLMWGLMKGVGWGMRVDVLKLPHVFCLLSNRHFHYTCPRKIRVRVVRAKLRRVLVAERISTGCESSVGMSWIIAVLIFSPPH
jgi:hypothetical protein